MVTANPSTLTPSSFTIKSDLNTTQLTGGLKDDTSQGFLNPVFGWALETTKNAVINKLKGFGIGLINTAVSELFGYFGINVGGSTPDPRFIQIENQIAAVNQKLDQIDTELTNFYNLYATNQVNQYQQNYNNIDSYVWQKYSTAANQIYATVPDGYDQSSSAASWIYGYLPIYSVESAISFNSKSIKKENTSFDPELLTDINNLSDDSGGTYFDINGNLTLSNNNGTWTSICR